MPNIFEQTQFEKPRMSAFDLSRQRKFSCDMGELIPTYIEEIIPGDQFRVRSEAMVRLAPMIAPVMHRINFYTHYFFVPNRLVWDEWEEFITGGQDGLQAPTFPVVGLESVLEDTFQARKRLSDYLGLPASQTDGTGLNELDVSELPFRAYQLIFNEYYRDPNLQTEIDITQSSDWILRKRAWEKDYFTSALSFRQRGEETTVPFDPQYKDVSDVKTELGADFVGQSNLVVGSDVSAGDSILEGDDGATPARIENLAAEQSGFNINDLRRSSAIQRWLEKSAIGGYRYIEQLAAQFGVRSSDARLQRPEYLGGGKQNVMISEVLNTSATETEPQGNMSGHGISTGASQTFQMQAEEHGYILGISSILPKPSYQQGVPKHWQRQDKFDYAWPDLANLGLQEVKNSELYYDPADQTYNEGTFGYQQRYAEYKYGCSQVNGDFRTSLDHWHAGRIFANQPNLNTDFVEMNAEDIDQRIFAAPSEQNFWIQMHHDVKARRPLPYFADPRLT